jgi:hypothetical protein
MKRVRSRRPLFAAAGTPFAHAAPPPRARPRRPRRDRAGARSPGQSLIEQDESAMSGRVLFDPAGPRPVPLALVREQNAAARAASRHRRSTTTSSSGIWKTKAGYVRDPATDNKSYYRAGDLLYDGEVTQVGPTRSRSGRTSTIRRA